jgi:GT2 family glycosyltransferase
MVTDVVAVSTLVPTIGRPNLLQSLLESLAGCRPAPAEVIVVDQSGESEIRRIVEGFAAVGARLVLSDRTGVARARNVGLEAAIHEVVLATDDDCTVAADWVGVAWEQMRQDPQRLLTGRVVPVGDPFSVPSWKDEPLSEEYDGKPNFSALFSGNMALSRSAALELGGFDENLRYASDNDFCYRWLKAGNRLAYEPRMIVWHHDWRTDEELEQLQALYAYWQGAVYAKHLRRGDFRIAALMLRDMYRGARGTASRLIRPESRRFDWRHAILHGLPAGFVNGWRTFGSVGRDERGRSGTESARG